MANDLVPTQEIEEALAAEEAFTLDLCIRQRRERIEAEFVGLGRDLAAMRDRELYRALGHETFEEYLASPELSFSRATAYILIAAVDVMDRLALPLERAALIGHVKLSMIRPAVAALPPDEGQSQREEREAQAEALLADAETLSRPDLRRRLRERHGVQTPIASGEAEKAEDAALGEEMRSHLTSGIVALAYDRWEGLTVRTASGATVRVRGAGDAPLRAEIEKARPF